MVSFSESSHNMQTRAVTRLNFHFTFVVAKSIHDKIIVIYLIFLYDKFINMFRLFYYLFIMLRSNHNVILCSIHYSCKDHCLERL